MRGLGGIACFSLFLSVIAITVSCQTVNGDVSPKKRETFVEVAPGTIVVNPDWGQEEGGQGAPRPPSPYQEEIGLSASAIGNRLFVQVQNNSASPISASPENFGIIVGPELHRFDLRQDVGQFPHTQLRPGESASGYLVFRTMGDLVGKRCVFYHPPAKPSMAIIEAESR